MGGMSECIRRQAKGKSIGFLDALLQRSNGIDDGHGAERFFTHHSRFARHLDERGYGVEISGTLETPTPGGHTCPLPLRILDHALNGHESAVIGDRPHLRTWLQSIANHDLLGCLDEGAHELLEQALMHVEPCGGSAYLPSISGLASGTINAGSDGIDVFAYDYRRMSPQLHQHRLHVPGCELG